jgi:UDP:flavonoid glycosyltransferase YjiC (YdhE family)
MLLPKDSAYITNGGSCGTQQAIAVGVPVIVVGLSEDGRPRESWRL